LGKNFSKEKRTKKKAAPSVGLGKKSRLADHKK